MKRLVLFLFCFATAAPAAVNETMLVSTQWLADHLRGVTVVHVAATQESYDAGHVPGAIFFPAEKFVATRNGVPDELPRIDLLQAAFEELGIGNRGRIVIVSDDPLLAARLFFTLDYLGHSRRICMVDGGLTLWKREKRALSTTSATRQRTAFTARVRPERLAYLTQMKKALDDARATIIDAREPAEFSGATAGEGIDRPGHIPGALNIPWSTTVDANGLLLGRAKLAALYAALAPNAPAIAYGRTGMKAAWTYFVLRYLGYDVALYDGSFVEWDDDLETAVER